jgi:hypothetical protein
MLGNRVLGNTVLRRKEGTGELRELHDREFEDFKIF